MAAKVRQKHPFRPARLMHHGYDLTKRWYIIFYAWDVSEDRMKRVRMFEPFNRIKNINERLFLGDQYVRIINGQLRDGKVLGRDKPIDNSRHDVNAFTVTQAIEDFLQTKKEQNARREYLARFGTVSRIWNLWISKTRVTDILVKKVTSNHLFEFFEWMKRERKISNTTYNNYRGDLSVFFNWIRKRHPEYHLPVNPVEIVPKLRVISKKHAAFTDEQMKSIREYCVAADDVKLLTFIHFIYYTLSRPGELRQLRGRHLELEENRIYIPGEISKNGKDEYVGLSQSLVRWIRKVKLDETPADNFLFGREKGSISGMTPVGEDFFLDRNRKVLDALKLTEKRYDVYSYKHSGAISLYKATKDIKIVQRQCRHQSIEQTNTYLRDLGVADDYYSTKDWAGAL